MFNIGTQTLLSGLSTLTAPLHHTSYSYNLMLLPLSSPPNMLHTDRTITWICMLPHVFKSSHTQNPFYLESPSQYLPRKWDQSIKAQFRQIWEPLPDFLTKPITVVPTSFYICLVYISHCGYVRASLFHKEKLKKRLYSYLCTPESTILWTQQGHNHCLNEWIPYFYLMLAPPTPCSVFHLEYLSSTSIATWGLVYTSCPCHWFPTSTTCGPNSSE